MINPKTDQSLDHDQISMMLPYYLNGALNSDDSTRVSAHLVACTPCAEQAVHLRTIAAAVRHESQRARYLPPLTVQLPVRRENRFVPMRSAYALAGMVCILFFALGMLSSWQIAKGTQSQYAAPPTPTLISPVTLVVLPVSYHADNHTIVPQTYNNDGPANLEQVLKHFGVEKSQAEIAKVLKPVPEDVSVSPAEMLDYIKGYTNGKLGALVRYAGNADLMKRLVAADFGVIVQMGYVFQQQGWFGHYFTVVGYEDSTKEFSVMDTALAVTNTQPMRYDAFDANWQQFNRLYMVIYPPARQAELDALLGSDANPDQNIQNAINIAQRETELAPTSPYVWFNLCQSYMYAKLYMMSTLACDQFNLSSGFLAPHRYLWYQAAPLEAYYRNGRYITIVAMTDNILEANPDLKVELIFYWRAMAENKQGKSAEAMKDVQKALKINPNDKAAWDLFHELQMVK